MQIILSYNNLQEVLYLPVLPAEIGISTGLSNNTFQVVDLGEIGVIGNRKLSTVSISSFFPKEYSSYCQYSSIADPYETVRLVEKWRDSKKPIKLVVTGTPVNMSCMIEDFNYKEKGGQPGDVYYDLRLKEYRFINPRQITQAGDLLSANSTRASEREVPTSYTINDGDDLLVIAKKLYGDGSLWTELYEKNKTLIGPDACVLVKGQVLKT